MAQEIGADVLVVAVILILVILSVILSIRAFVKLIIQPKKMDKEIELEHFALGNSLLPMSVDDNGTLVEVIVCDSISGGANYRNDMPADLSIIRRTIDGKESRARYAQVYAEHFDSFQD